MAKAKTAQPVFNLAGSPAGLSAFSADFAQKALHQRHIEPFIEFSADFALNSH
jgi:hypothetical protein